MLTLDFDLVYPPVVIEDGDTKGETDMSTMTWSDKQIAVFQWAMTGVGNAVIEAVAGAGKTTTLIELIRRFKAMNVASTVAICAYNKKMGDELAAKTKGIEGVSAGTLHSFGFKAILRSSNKKPVVDGNKIRTIVDHMVEGEYERFKQCSSFVVKLVGLAKEVGVGFFNAVDDKSVWQNIIDHHDLSVENEFEHLYDELIDMAITVLKVSNANREVIDFADMILHTLIHNARVLQYDVVLVDEAQDTNPTRRALAAKMLRPGGRLVAVGDPRQAIFGFTGADNDSLDQIKTDFDATTLLLTVSYRCAKSVVAHARKWVSHIESAPDAPEGEVINGKYQELLDGKFELTNEDAILCRKTAPLVDLAFTLIRRGTACRIEGRDIGQQLVNLVRKYKVRTLAQLRHRIREYRDREVQKALSKGIETKADQINDRVDTLFTLIDRAAELKYEVDGLVNMIYEMFGDSDKSAKKLLTLSTIHKAKGIEWNRVFLLGRAQFQPSKFAIKAWQKEQETNLIYVAITRAKTTLVEIDEVPQGRPKEASAA